MTTALAPGKATTAVSFPLKDFKTAFGSVARAVPGRTSQTVLLCVRLDLSPGVAVFTSTNLELWIVHRMLCDYTGPAASLLLDRTTLASILRVAAGPTIDILAAGTTLKVTAGSKTWTMPTDDPAIFPAVPKLEMANYHEVDAEWLATAIRRVVKETRPGVTEGYATAAIQVELTPEGMGLAACSSKSLARQMVPAARVGEQGWPGPLPLVPETAMRTVQGLLKDASGSIRFGFPDRNNVQFEVDETTILARLTEGKFAKWREYLDGLPAVAGTTTIDCGAFRTAVEAAAISLDEQTRTLLFRFTAAELRISSGSSKGQSHATEPIEWAGPDAEVAIDPSYLLNMLKAIGDEVAVTVKFYSKDSPLILETSDGFLGFVQPMSR